MNLYLTTHVGSDAIYRCILWSGEPVQTRGPYGIAWKRGDTSAKALLVMRPTPAAYCKALGFPPPGQIRTIEIPPYEGDTDDR